MACAELRSYTTRLALGKVQMAVPVIQDPRAISGLNEALGSALLFFGTLSR